ncbi:MAG: hypothetical protein ACLQU1_11170, partial [Bryobacteraceae bacterium]
MPASLLLPKLYGASGLRPAGRDLGDAGKWLNRLVLRSFEKFRELCELFTGQKRAAGSRREKLSLFFQMEV